MSSSPYKAPPPNRQSYNAAHQQPLTSSPRVNPYSISSNPGSGANTPTAAKTGSQILASYRARAVLSNLHSNSNSQQNSPAQTQRFLHHNVTQPTSQQPPAAANAHRRSGYNSNEGSGTYVLDNAVISPNSRRIQAMEAGEADDVPQYEPTSAYQQQSSATIRPTIHVKRRTMTSNQNLPTQSQQQQPTQHTKTPSGPSLWSSLRQHKAVRSLVARLQQRQIWLQLGKLAVALFVLYYLITRTYEHYDNKSKLSNLLLVSVLTHDTRALFTAETMSSWQQHVPKKYIHVVTDNVALCQSLPMKVQCHAVNSECLNTDLKKLRVQCLFNDIHQFASKVKSPSEQTLVLMQPYVPLAPALLHSLQHINERYDDYIAIGSAQSLTEVQQMLRDGKGPAANTLQHIDLLVAPLSTFNELPQHVHPQLLYNTLRWDQYMLSSVILNNTLRTIDVSLALQQMKLQPVAVEGSQKAIQHNKHLTLQHNPQLYKHGIVQNSALSLIGRCSSDDVAKSSEPLSESADDTDDGCAVVQNAGQDVAVVYARQANSEGWVTVLGVNIGFINFALNWLCWIERLGYRNYLIIAGDKQSFKRLTARGSTVRKLTEKLTDKVGALAITTLQHSEFELAYATHMQSILDAGYHVITTDADTVWYSDPTQVLHPQADIQASVSSTSASAAAPDMSLSFLAIRSNTDTRLLWQQVVQCQRTNVQWFQLHDKCERDEAVQHCLQQCVNTLTHQMLMKSSAFRRHTLPTHQFPTSASHFLHHESIKAGSLPVVVHAGANSPASTLAIREKVLRDSGLYSGRNADTLTCASEPSQPAANTAVLAEAGAAPSWRLSIKISAGDEPDSLNRLLVSLVAAQYPSNAQPISVEVSIDEPQDNNDEQAVNSWMKVQALTTNFKWPYGPPIKVVHHAAHHTLFGHWPGAEVADDEVLLILDEHTTVDSSYYETLNALIGAYYTNSSAYDAQMFGISLARQDLIIGDSKLWRSTQRPSSEVLTMYHSPSLYRAQTLGFTGQAFFPKHWQQFADWLASQRQRSDGSDLTPCVPTLLTNALWLQEVEHEMLNATHHNHADSAGHTGIAMWQQWWLRYMYERGWYSAVVSDSVAVVTDLHPSRYTALFNGTAPAFLQSKANVVKQPSSALTSRAALPSPDSLPLFDFHMRQVKHANTLPFRSSLAYNLADQCHMIASESDVAAGRSTK